MKNNDFFIKQIDEIVNEFIDIKARAQYSDLSENTTEEERKG